MVNTRQLEKKWYKYKAKKIVIILFYLFLLLLLLGGGYYAYIQYIKKPSEQVNNKDVLTKIELTDQINKETPEELEVVERKDEVSLDPVIPIVDIEKEERKKSKIVSVKKTSVKKTHITSHKKSTSTRVKAKHSAYLTDKELATINESLDSKKIKKINMTTTSVNYIETIKKKFIKTKKPREAMLLAKAYYAKKEYSKSEEWALRANRLNNKLDESWLLFAKSKVKLGKRDEALQILVSYYKKSHSSKAKALIEKIKTERL